MLLSAQSSLIMRPASGCASCLPHVSQIRASNPLYHHSSGNNAIGRHAAVTGRKQHDRSANVSVRYQAETTSTASLEATVDTIMRTHPSVLKPEMTCNDAARFLLDNDISCAPVVDDSGQLVGILSESDLLWKSSGPLDHTIIPPVFVGAFDLLISLRDTNAVKQEVDKILAHTVGQAMTKKPSTVTPSTTVSAAAKALLQSKVHMVPVVDNKNHVVGVLSQHDILRSMVAQKTPL